MLGTDDKNNYVKRSQLLKSVKPDAEPMEVLMMDHNVTGNIQKISKYISYISFKTYLNCGRMLTTAIFDVIFLN